MRLPLLERRETVKTVAIVPITGDRGLAGAFNAQVLRRAFALMREAQAAGQEVRFFSSGKKAQSTIRFRRLALAQAWTGFSEKPATRTPRRSRTRIAEAYVNERGRPRRRSSTTPSSRRSSSG